VTRRSVAAFLDALVADDETAAAASSAFVTVSADVAALSMIFEANPPPRPHRRFIRSVVPIYRYFVDRFDEIRK
jgi:hypothetical protein